MDNTIVVMFTAYNDGETLGPLITQVQKITDNSCDLLVVDDGSTDNTQEIIAEHGCINVCLEQNQGVGAAYKAGFEKILAHDGYKYVIKIDADGQHDVAFISKIIHTLKAGFGPVVCSRFHPDTEHRGAPLDRVVLNDCFASHLSRRTGWSISDARSGFFGLTIDQVRLITPHLITKRYGIPMEVMVRVWAYDKHPHHLEIPHPSIYKGHGNSRRAEQYSEENGQEKLARFIEAYHALVAVYRDLNWTAEDLIEHLKLGRMLAETE